MPSLETFYTLIRDYPERGGKRLRGLLVLLSAGAHGADWRGGSRWRRALELFQNWVLIHDDIEDDSEERRGAPRSTSKWGCPWRSTSATRCTCTCGKSLHEMERAVNVWKEILREFAWMIQRTAEGQHLDLSWISAGRFRRCPRRSISRWSPSKPPITRSSAPCASARSAPGPHPTRG